MRDEEMLSNEECCVLSEVQKGMYFDCLVGNSAAYNISFSLLIEDLKYSVFNTAFKLVVAEQLSLRSRIVSVADELKLELSNSVVLDLQEHSIADADCADLDELYASVIAREFDLNQDQMFRAMLYKLDKNKHVFIFVSHHIVTDGISLDIIRKKILDNYTALSNNTPVQLSTDAGYFKYICNENKKLSTNKYAKHKSYWISKLQGAEPLSLCYDFARNQKLKSVGKEVSFAIPSDLASKIQDIEIGRAHV